MKPNSPSRCRLFAALVVLLFSGLLPATETPPVQRPLPMLAQFKVKPLDQDHKEQQPQQLSSSVGANSAAYLITVVIPIMLFIVMIGFVRRKDA